jgi:hypothetical protein
VSLGPDGRRRRGPVRAAAVPAFTPTACHTAELGGFGFGGDESVEVYRFPAAGGTDSGIVWAIAVLSDGEVTSVIVPYPSVSEASEDARAEGLDEYRIVPLVFSGPPPGPI